MNSNMKSLHWSNLRVRILCSLASILLVTGSLTMAQGEREFIDKADGFKLTLVANWRAVPYTDAVGRQKTEFVYENREQGTLRITRENLRGSSLQSMVRRNINEFTLCNPCTQSAQEEFAGNLLSGIRVGFDYVEGNRKMVSTFYFLKERETVWILRFNGRVGSPGMEHDVTDSIVRSFCSVCSWP